MGGGRWSTDVYSERARARRASGESAFSYHERVKESGDLKAHPTLDPHGVLLRESRDSEEHPESNAISVFLDVTGSMRRIPVVVQKNLPQLLGLLLFKEYIPHPQILFGAVGDANSDHVPLQVGQFESDNRMDENLQNLVLEGGGGPYGMESYEMVLYFMARHTGIDCWEKRRQKGYLFLIGDEMAYPAVSKGAANAVIDAGLQADIPLKTIIGEVREKYNVYFIIPTGASGGDNEKVRAFWKTHLGEQHVMTLSDPENIAELIALTIGMREGTVGMEDGIGHLRDAGMAEGAIAEVKEALSVLPPGSSLARGSGGSLIEDDGDDGTRRL